MMKTGSISALLLMVAVALLFIAMPERDDSVERQPPVVHPDHSTSPHTTESTEQTESRRAVAPTEEVMSTVAVTVTTALADRGRNPADPIGNVPFEIGASRWDGRVFHQLGGVHNGVTDEKGTATVHVDLSKPSSEEPMFLWGRAVRPGFQTKIARVRLSDDHFGNEPPDTHLVLLTGNKPSLHGRLLDREGCPVRGSLQAYRQEGDQHWTRISGTRCDRRGEFWIDCEVDGRYRLTAQAEGVGSATVGPLMVLSDSPSEPLSITLRGPGVIRGRVIDATHQPTAGLRVLTLTHEADDDEGSFATPQEVSDRYELEGAGLYWATGVTDADGRFEFTGLRDDRFVVRARTDRFGGYPILLTQQPVRSDGGELTLTFDRPHLVVVVQDAEGNRLEVRDAHREKWREFLSRWPEEPMVMVLPTPETADTSDVSALACAGTKVSPGEFTYELKDDSDYYVVLYMPGVPPQPKRVTLPEGCGRVEVVMQATSPLATGTLSVMVRDPSGAEVEDEVSVRVFDVETNLCLIERTRWWRSGGREPWPAIFELPIGEYRLTVESIPYVDPHHGILMTPRAFGDFRAPLTITEKGMTEVIATLREPAWLDLNLEGTIAQNELNALEGSGDSDWNAHRASIRLHRKGHYPLEVFFIDEELFAGTSAAGQHLVSSLKIGTRGTSAALTPGRYRLVASTTEGRMATRDIELVAGQTAVVELDLDTD